MKKLLLIILFVFTISNLQIVSALELSDPQDKFTVSSPSPNSKVSGTIPIEWISFDNNQDSVPFVIELFDSLNCKESLGRISSNNSGISSLNQKNRSNWNTQSTLSNQNIKDNTYCLQLCTALKKEAQFYSVCNARNITIINTNNLANIESLPTKLIINETEKWEYQLKATDPDSDNLTYYLVYAPNFLNIDPKSGLITMNNNPRIALNLNIAEYRVVVGVDDNLSGTTTQEFNLRIERGRAENQVSNINPSLPKPQNSPSSIVIDLPKENQEFSGKENKIEWSVLDADGISSIELLYSNNLTEFFTIAKVTESSFYNWDVSTLSDGKYYIQLKVTDKKGEGSFRISKQFSIKNLKDTEPILSKPLIINLKPENTRELTESPAQITADFAVAEGLNINIDSFILKLNNNQINDCVVNESGFVCTIKDTLPAGKHLIDIIVKDSNGVEGSYQSEFSIAPKTNVAPTNNTATNNGSTVLIAVVVGLVIILMILPWLLIALSKKGKKKQVKLNGNNTPIEPNSITPFNSTNYVDSMPEEAPTEYIQATFPTQIQQQQGFNQPIYTEPIIQTNQEPTEYVEPTPIVDEPVQEIQNQYVEPAPVEEFKNPENLDPKIESELPKPTEEVFENAAMKTESAQIQDKPVTLITSERKIANTLPVEPLTFEPIVDQSIQNDNNFTSPTNAENLDDQSNYNDNQYLNQNYTQDVQKSSPLNNNPDLEASFADFTSSYSFNNPSTQNPQPQKVNNTNFNLNQTSKPLANTQAAPSPIAANSSQDSIQMAYSGMAGSVPSQSEDDLKKLYPELYGDS